MAVRTARGQGVPEGPTDPEWYREAVIYEVHVRAFSDADGDGVGDFRGLTEKLDYLKDLGVTAVWLLPFYPSPLKDDGYDITDYTAVHPAYGDMKDVKRFIREAHRRDLRVITELVCNHTSDQHPWFQRARRAPKGSRARKFYVWSDTAEEYADARVIFQDFESSNWTWDPVAQAYYWHRFYSHQPDLNFENPDVERAILKALDHWFSLGVDGLRLDAVPYLYEREGTNCENLPETHAFLRRLREHVDERFKNRMLLAEANQWPENAAAYFGDGDECHMAFHFPLMPRLFLAIRMEDRFPIVDILAQTPDPPDGGQWALFLRNHDELTLEMVSHEERHFMYKNYAQDVQSRVNMGIRRRLAPLLGNHRRRVELMMSLLLSLPGTPVIYYGDEIGMGDNIYLGDRNGVRTPMQWSADRNAGFSKANRQRLYLPVIVDPEYHYEAVNVASQEQNPHALLNWTKRLIALRKRHPALGRGALGFVQTQNAHILAFVRSHGDERILVLANLSRFAQAASLDLSAFAGAVPVEMFSNAAFPRVTERPYPITFGPHDFFWFVLEGGGSGSNAARGSASRLRAGTPDAVFDEGAKALAPLLRAYLPVQRWFGAKGRDMKGVTVEDVLPIPGTGVPTRLLIAGVDFGRGERERYALPIAVLPRGGMGEGPPSLGTVETPDGVHDVVDGLHLKEVAHALLEAIRARRTLRGARGRLVARPGTALKGLLPGAAPDPFLGGAEQSNSSVAFGESVILKLFRRLQEGENPEVEMGRFLTEQVAFPHAAAFAGSLGYVADGKTTTLATLGAFVPSAVDALNHAEGHLKVFIDTVALLPGPPPAADPPAVPTGPLGVPSEVSGLIGGYLDDAALLGRRTAELHLALASRREPSDFAPEPFTDHDRSALHQAVRALTGKAFAAFRAELPDLPEPAGRLVAAALGMEGEVLSRLKTLLAEPFQARRIRCHGDYHLGQVLYTGTDFMIVDFEGEPARTLEERRIKQCPLKDVAGMVRSFDYAARIAVLRGVERERQADLVPWARLWSRWVSAAFLAAYRRAVEGTGLLPSDDAAFGRLLEVFLLEKAVYELYYELEHRPDWAPIPMDGLRDILEGRA